MKVNTDKVFCVSEKKISNYIYEDFWDKIPQETNGLKEELADRQLFPQTSAEYISLVKYP